MSCLGQLRSSGLRRVLHNSQWGRCYGDREDPQPALGLGQPLASRLNCPVTRRRVEVSVDGPNLVSHAGLLQAASLWQRLG